MASIKDNIGRNHFVIKCGSECCATRKPQAPDHLNPYILRIPQYRDECYSAIKVWDMLTWNPWWFVTSATSSSILQSKHGWMRVSRDAFMAPPLPSTCLRAIRANSGCFALYLLYISLTSSLTLPYAASSRYRLRMVQHIQWVTPLTLTVLAEAYFPLVHSCTPLWSI